MSPKNKSKKRASEQGHGGSRSKQPSRRSTSRQHTPSGRAAEGAKSGLEESKRGKRGAPGTPDAPEEKKPQRRRLRKRVPIGEALRKQGLDEHTVAESYANVVSRLEKNPANVGSGDKLLIEILKECTRQIEATQPVGEGAIQVQLVHNVERPTRTQPAAETAVPAESK